MINPYAHSFMIATRTDHIAPQRIFAARDVTMRKKGLQFFRKLRRLDAEKL